MHTNMNIAEHCMYLHEVTIPVHLEELEKSS
jgi:hypothetical protein